MNLKLVFVDSLYLIIQYQVLHIECNNQSPDFDDMSSFFPCEIDDGIEYINLGYGAQTPNIVIL